MYGKSENRDDYQDGPRPLAAMARDLPDAHHIPAHTHRRAQLIYGTSGAITVVTGRGTWVVPATRGVWVPAGVTHAMTCTGAVRMRTLYVELGAWPGLPGEPTVVAVSPLLRELIEAATRIPLAYAPGSRDEAVMNLLLHELAPHPVPALHLPTPADPELGPLCSAIRADPGRRWTTAEAAARAHLSARSLQRRFPEATGMTLSHWVQQARLLAAISLLAQGVPVTAISARLGYATPSAFTAMFRRALGVSPSGYFTDGRETGRGARRQPVP
ncbi:helix-turn-helix domain-containing protein [Streptomyces sp. NPDC059785]|uniref:AraC family transcriptional regulator n=1 Tax=unclassified Streptomyces TaxID=2593676 RepID=UPI003649FBA1